MPITPTYPGVYIEEIKSGVHTITGVATSITAFVGSADRGPDNDPTVINSFADYERIFGGLSISRPLGFAVNDFFLNGGSQAIIVRLVTTAPAAAAVPAVAAVAAVPAPASPATLDLPTPAKAPDDFLHLVAASKGKWGGSLSATADLNTKDKTNQKLFNLNISELDSSGATLQAETFLNVSIQDSDPRYVPKVLRDGSSLVRVQRNAANTDWIVPNAAPVTPLTTADTAKGAATVSVGSTAGFPAKGTVYLQGAAVGYTGITPTSFTGCSNVPLTSFPVSVRVTAQGGDDGGTLTDLDYLGDQAKKTGIFALEKADLFNLLCLPPEDQDISSALVGTAAAYCETRRAMLLVDPPSAWTNKAAAVTAAQDLQGNVGTNSANAAIFFPRLRKLNPLRDGQLDDFVPCGVVAGIFARTDAQRGVWKAPAGIDATLVGVPQLTVPLTDPENGELNPLGVNCLRAFPVIGRVVWGARTMRGADILADDYKYVPVRRLALFLEESLYRGTKWVVFEPNDEPLWAQIRLNVGAFMNNLFRQGAFQGTTPAAAYFVKCDKESTTQTDINLGIVNIIVGFAPLKPAEFVIIKIQQITGQIDV